MATPKSQRIGILVILIVMVIGTIGSFLVLILSSKNTQKETAAYQAAYEKYQADTATYQKKVDAQSDELSRKYYSKFKAYASYPAKFSKDSIAKLTTQDLVIGSGATIGDTSSFAAYYIGWQPDGTVFDQSIENNKLKAPLTIDGLSSAAMIEGWKEGLKGMKVGGVRMLEIPSDKAYGEAGKTDQSTGKETIAPNTPLKFVVMAVDKPAAIAMPPLPKELLQGVSY